MRAWVSGAASACFVLAAGVTPAVAQAPTPPPVAQTQWTMPSDEAIGGLLAERMKNNGVGLVVGIVRPDGRSIVAHGVYDKDDPRRIDGDTVFQIGSLTKPFTGLLLADMAARGEVGLDDPVSKYLPPGVKMAERGRPMTLRDLARHVSGLPSMPSNMSVRGQPDPYEAYTEQQLWTFVSTWQPTRAPGEAGQYSNFGFALLGRLLAQRAGQDYEALIKERVLAPLGMTSSSINLSPEQERRLAPGHDRYLRVTDGWEMVVMPASGSLRTSANDMLKLMGAYLDPERGPLSAAIKLQLKDGEGAEKNVQALGWTIRPDGVTFKDGGKSGYRTGAAFNQRTRTAVFVFANARTDDQPINLALHLLTGRPLEPAPAAPPQTPIAKLTPEVLERYVGRYKLASGEVVEIDRRGGYLVLHAPGNGALELHPTSDTDFFLNTGNDEYIFRIGGGGKTEGVTQYGDGRSGEGAFAPRIGGLDG